MCLITFAYRSHPEYSLILLANRDEFYQRPTRAMNFWQEDPNILAGQDLEQGGTWLGLNKAGKFTTVTNYRNGRERRDGLRSRGHLTRDYLTGDTNATEYLATLTAEQQRYGAFNLLLGDQQGLHYLSNRSNAQPQRLGAGVYGLSNALLDSPWPKLQKVKQGLKAALHASELSTQSLIDIMLDPTEADTHQLPDTGISAAWEKSLSACFIRIPEYGTRATTLLMQKPDGSTYIREQNFDAQGEGPCHEYQLDLPPIGISQE